MCNLHHFSNGSYKTHLMMHNVLQYSLADSQESNLKAHNVCTVCSGYSGHVYSGHSDIVATFLGTKIHLFYYIQVRYSGQSDIVARKVWPQVATISEMHCTISHTAEFHESHLKVHNVYTIFPDRVL